MLILTNLFTLEIPQLAKTIVNAVEKGEPLGQYTNLTLIIVALGLLLIGIRTLSRVFIFRPGRELETSIKVDLFDHLLSMPLARFLTFGMGDLTSRLNSDVTQLRVFFAFGVLQVLNVVLMSSLTIVKMVSISPLLTFLCVLPLIFMLVLTKYISPILYVATKQNSEATGRLTNRVSEMFANVQVIQCAGAEDAFISRASIESEQIFKTNMKTVLIRNLVFPLMTVMTGTSQFCLLYWGGKAVINGAFTVGDLMAFAIYIGILVFPFTSIGLILAIYQRARPAVERLQAIAFEPSESEGQNSSAVLELKQSALYSQSLLIRAESLSFSFDSKTEVLKDISFQINRGDRIGVFGRVGSGKSVLFELLTKLYEVPRGMLFFHGHDYGDLSPEFIRSKIGFAQQSPFLFSDSIKNNLLLGFDSGQVTDAQLDQAAEQAQVLDDIKGFVDGWDTLCGEGGVRLSGGQKQRLALARVILRSSELMILDDVLSAVDHTTEQQLIQSLFSDKNRTMLIASHRPSILEHCDRIWILERGMLVAQGRFADVKHFMDLK
jgi:ATP-binding cassette subfamily B multidrug efflux pump